MRIPKFRVWDKEEEVLLETMYIDFEHERIYCRDSSSNTVTRRWLRFNKSELMQSTGLKDKNGVEIFEEDIVLVNNLLVGSIFWNRYQFLICTYSKKEYNYQINYLDLDRFGNEEGYSSCLEVIGNSFENPGLTRVE